MAMHVDKLIIVASSGQVRLVGLHIHSYSVQEALAQRLFRSPAMQTLRSLSARMFSRDTFALIAQLPQLTSLKIAGRPAVSALRLLLDAPSLSHLDICDSSDEASSPLLELVSQLPHLRRLRVHGPRLQSASFVAFCSTPSMSRLESLCLAGWRKAEVRRISMQSFGAGFAALVSLRSLELDDCAAVDLLASHLIRAPKLVALAIAGLTDVPATTMRSLLQSLPLLCIAAHHTSTTMRKRIRELKTLFPGRLHVQ